MSLTYNLLCLILGHNIHLKKTNALSKSVRTCKCCEYKLENVLDANLENLSDVQLEVKKTIRELFLLTHRRNRQKALSRSYN